MNEQRPGAVGGLVDLAAFTGFYRTHLPTVYGYLLRLTGGDRALAEDLTQDAWLALANELCQGNTERADIRWLLTVARTRFIDHRRRQTRWERVSPVLAAARDEQVPEPTRGQILDGITELEPDHRLVLMLRYIDDLPVADVAAAIDRSLVATTSLLARACAALRDQHWSVGHA